MTELKPCPFCGLSVTQEINIHDSGGDGNRYMHTAKIEHICDGGDFGRPQAKALELFCAKERNERLLASCAEAQAKRWNTRHESAKAAEQCICADANNAKCPLHGYGEVAHQPVGNTTTVTISETDIDQLAVSRIATWLMQKYDQDYDASKVPLDTWQQQAREIWALVRHYPRPPARESGWQIASTATNPTIEGDYLTIYRDDHWQPGHYIQKVVRFSLGNSCTGHIWGAQVGIDDMWHVKYWQPLPAFNAPKEKPRRG